MVVLVVVIAVTVVLAGGLLVVFARGGIGEHGSARLPAGLFQVTAAPSRLFTRRRPEWRSRSRSGRTEDPAEVERLVREQLYGRRGQHD